MQPEDVRDDLEVRLELASGITLDPSAVPNKQRRRGTSFVETAFPISTGRTTMSTKESGSKRLS